MYPSVISLFIITLTTLICMQCKTPPFIPGESKHDFIRFGNGGGFTGAVKAYFLTDDGQLYKEEGEKPVLIGKVSSDLAKQMFLVPEVIQADSKPYNMPGNRYFFIDYSIGGSKQKVMWGGEPMPYSEYETWYKNLMFVVKKQNLSTNINVE